MNHCLTGHIVDLSSANRRPSAAHEKSLKNLQAFSFYCHKACVNWHTRKVLARLMLMYQRAFSKALLLLPGGALAAPIFLPGIRENNS